MKTDSETPDLSRLAAGLAELLADKQRAYGDSFGRSGAVLRILYPDGIPPAAYDDVLTLARIIDKLFRIATAKGKPDRHGESPWLDVAGYALLALERDHRQAVKGPVLAKADSATG